MKRFLVALDSLRALPALCCHNLGDVPRPGSAHIPANREQNKPLAESQEAPSQPPPAPPHPAASPSAPFFFFLPYNTRSSFLSSLKSQPREIYPEPSTSHEPECRGANT